MINLDQELTWLKACEDLVELENRYQRILGKKGYVSEALKTLTQLPIEEKKIQWGQISALKTALQTGYEECFERLKLREINAQLAEDIVDISLPGTPVEQWYFSLLSKVRRELEEIARGWGLLLNMEEMLWANLRILSLWIFRFLILLLKCMILSILMS